MEEIGRIKLPKNNEMLGVVEARLGAGKFSVRCKDGNTRICRIPGRLRKSLWVYENDIVLVEPWDIQGERRGDIIHKYTKPHEEWLRKKKMLDF